MAKYLSKVELREKYAYYQSMVDFYRNQLKSAKQGLYRAKANGLTKQIEELEARRDALLAKQEALDKDASDFEAKIAEYSGEKAKIAFLLSKHGQAVFDMLGKVPPRHQDRILVAIFSAVTDDSIDLNAILQEVFKDK